MKVCVFCSSKAELVAGLSSSVEAFSSCLAEEGIDLVYGGSRDGLMGAVADGLLQKGGKVHGVFPKNLFGPEVAHKNLTHFVETENMLDRKDKMMALSDIFVVFPGGLGTLDEALEVLTWKSLGQLQGEILFFNWQGFWGPFQSLLQDLEKRGVLYPEALSSYKMVDTIEELCKELRDAGKPTSSLA